MRRILIGASRHIEYDLRNDFFAHLQRLPLVLLPGAPDRRPDVARHQRPERRADDDRAVGDVLRRTRCSASWRRSTLMLAIDPRLTLLSLIPLPFVSISVKYLRQRDPPALRADPGAALRGQRRRPGVALRRPRRPRLPAGSGRARALPPRERGVPAPQPAADRAAGLLLPEHGVLPRARRDAGAVARQPRGHPGRITLGEFVAFNAYLTMLAWPMIAFGWVTNMLQRGMASWKRMLEVLDTGARHPRRGLEPLRRRRRFGRRAIGRRSSSAT